MSGAAPDAGPSIELADVEAAAARLAGRVLRTPLVRLGAVGGDGDALGERGGVGPGAASTVSSAPPSSAPPSSGAGGLWLKAESLQEVGSFKARGALNCLLTLIDERRGATPPGVVAHSSGNHAQAVAWAAARLGLAATVVMPDDAPPRKRAATEAWGAEVIVVGPDSAERAERCDLVAAERGWPVVAPYDDPTVMAGAGTVGLEVLDDLPRVAAVLVPVSGGGLISGIAGAVNGRRPDVAVIGVEPEVADDARRSLAVGERIAIPAEQASSTIADGLRVRQVGAHPWTVIRRSVDRIVTVTEDEIVAAMGVIAGGARLVAEPSGAVATAAWCFHRSELGLPDDALVVAVLSGGNVEPDLLARSLA
ncbi:MAG: threonine/serine dehydratase [Acidimicrobiales bacterium]